MKKQMLPLLFLLLSALNCFAEGPNDLTGRRIMLEFQRREKISAEENRGKFLADLASLAESKAGCRQVNYYVFEATRSEEDTLYYFLMEDGSICEVHPLRRSSVICQKSRK